MTEKNTLVLKAHIALASAVFPQQTSGSELDLIARQPLLKQGLDYEHGTGHGVGFFSTKARQEFPSTQKTVRRSLPVW